MANRTRGLSNYFYSNFYLSVSADAPTGAPSKGWLPPDAVGFLKRRQHERRPPRAAISLTQWPAQTVGAQKRPLARGTPTNIDLGQERSDHPTQPSGSMRRAFAIIATRHIKSAVRPRLTSEYAVVSVDQLHISTLRPGTLEKCLRLFVTRVMPWDTACDAIRRSIFPIGSPERSN
jgi:hypothetical protein